MSLAILADDSVSSFPAALLADHAAAVNDFVLRASAIPAERWDIPRAPGKWTPAQETRHVTLGYEAYIRDLRGEGTLRLKGKWWQRQLWHWVVLPQILRARRIGRAAPAPREVRPPEHPGGQEELLAQLTDQVAVFESTLLHAHSREPRRRVTHPYFNALTLEQLLRLCAVHTRHHAAFLPQLSG